MNHLQVSIQLEKKEIQLDKERQEMLTLTVLNHILNWINIVSREV